METLDLFNKEYMELYYGKEHTLLLEELHSHFARAYKAFMENYAFELYKKYSLSEHLWSKLSYDELSEIMGIPKYIVYQYIQTKLYMEMNDENEEVEIEKQIDFIETSVRLYFASPDHNSISQEEYECICEAVRSARRNLYSRHRVRITNPVMVKDDWGNYCVFELEIPKEIYDNFNIGNHLRGISKYLLKTYPDRFEPLLVGKRLLSYEEKKEEEKK